MCCAIFSSFNAHTDDYSSSKSKQNVNDEANLLLLLKILYRVSKLLWLNLPQLCLDKSWSLWKQNPKTQGSEGTHNALTKYLKGEKIDQKFGNWQKISSIHWKKPEVTESLLQPFHLDWYGSETQISNKSTGNATSVLSNRYELCFSWYNLSWVILHTFNINLYYFMSFSNIKDWIYLVPAISHSFFYSVMVIIQHFLPFKMDFPSLNMYAYIK